MIRKTNSSEVFDIFAKTMNNKYKKNIIKNASFYRFLDDIASVLPPNFHASGPLKTLDDTLVGAGGLGILRFFRASTENTDLFVVSKLFSDVASDTRYFRAEDIQKFNTLATKYGFADGREAMQVLRDFKAKLDPGISSGNPSVINLTGLDPQKINRSLEFMSSRELRNILEDSKAAKAAALSSASPSALPPLNTPATPAGTPAIPTGSPRTPATPATPAGTPRTPAKPEGSPRMPATPEGSPRTPATLADPDAIPATSWLSSLIPSKSMISFGLFSYAVYYIWSSITESDRSKAADNIITSKSCLDEINTVSGTKAESMKASLSQDLERFNQMTSITSGRVTEEFVRSYAELMDRIGGTGEGSIFAFANHLQKNPGELVDGLSDQVLESVSCVVTNFNEARKIIMSLPAKIMDARKEDAGEGRSSTKVPSISGGKNYIFGDVTLSNGSTHTVVITTRRPSIPPLFILFFQDGRNPFFSSPTFTAFVDPDGRGLVPNAVGKPLAGDGRIAAAIKYCYNNGIKTESDLREDVIRSINSGLSPLRKLFKNEPEQKAFKRMIKEYKGGGGSGSESFSDDHMDINKSSEYHNNLFESINKTSSTMNKLALSNDKITYHEDAVKGLKDKLTKSYYAGLDSMYNEKPKAQKTDLKDLYGFQEETGYDLLMEAHPKSTYLAEAMGDGGLVENGLEQKVKSEAVALSVPSGNFRSKYAETHAYLNKLLKVAEAENKTEVSNLIKQTINQFFN